MSAAGRWFRSVARWSAILGALLLSAELFARVDDALTWHVPMWGIHAYEKLTIRDSLGIHGRPHYRYQKWRMNNFGFRGRDMRALPTPGAVRVVVIGASETFGLYEAEGNEYPARTQVVLDSLAPGCFEVINTALPGMGLASMALFYERIVAAFRPAFVLIYPTPTFYLEVNPPPDMPTIREGPFARRGVLSSIALYSRFFGKSRDIAKELVPRAVVTAYRDRRLRRVRSKYNSDWVWQKVPLDRMALFEAHLDRVVRHVLRLRAVPVLVTHTTRFAVSHPDTSKQNRRQLLAMIAENYPKANPSVLVAIDTAANRIIRGTAAKHGTPVIEAEGRIPATPQYFADYSHLTDAGADRMAHVLAAELLRLRRGADSMAPTDTCVAASGAGDGYRPR